MNGFVVTPYGQWPKQIFDKAARIKLIVTDVDGVLTDGTVYISEHGETLKPFNSKDGLGVKLTMKHGYQWAVISGRTSKPLLKRMHDLGIEHTYANVLNKCDVLQELWQATGFTPEQTLFIGDDLIDLDAMMAVGFCIAVADAHPWIKQQSHWCTSLGGGKGAVREVCDLLLMCPNGPFSYWIDACKT